MEIKEMYLSGMSIPEISSDTGIALSTIRFRLKKLNVLRSIKDASKIAAAKGKFSHSKGKTRIFSDQWKRNISAAKIRYADDNAKGTSLKPSGYIEITRGLNKSRSEHVVIMEESIGRRLFSNECVHHKDGNRSNNDISNLELMTRSEHARLHAKENNINRQRTEKGKYS